MAFPKRIDQNQGEIVKVLRKMGASVQIISEVGKGCPDIICGYRGVNYLIEIKNGNKKLTECEQEFFDNWKGQATIIRSLDEAIAYLENLIRN